SQTLTYVRGGKMKAFAVMAHTRWPSLPDVPTTDEIGAPGMYISFWHGLWVTKGTPKEVIIKLNGAVVDTLADPAVRQHLTDLGQVIATREQQTQPRSVHSTRPRSRSGGRSSKRPTSRSKGIEPRRASTFPGARCILVMPIAFALIPLPRNVR